MKMSLKYNRILALIIDVFLVGIIQILWVNLIGPIQFPKNYLSLLGFNFIFGLSYLPFLFLLYFFICDFFASGKTVGKTIIGIKNVNEYNLSLSIRFRLLRSTLKVVTIIMWPISGILYALFDITLQDYVCKTKTVKYNKLGLKKTS